MKSFLTPKQKEVLDFISSSSEAKGYAPSQWEIAKHFKFKSLGTVQHYLVQLQNQGYLEKTWNARRSTKVNSQGVSLELPLLGLVAAGRPIEVVEGIEKFAVANTLLQTGKNYFCLKVEGDSMIEEHICNGDIVLIKEQNRCENGDIVVALVDGEATLKRFHKKERHIELRPANARYKPIIVRDNQEIRIAGVYAGLFRMKP